MNKGKASAREEEEAIYSNKGIEERMGGKKWGQESVSMPLRAP